MTSKKRRKMPAVKQFGKGARQSEQTISSPVTVAEAEEQYRRESIRMESSQKCGGGRRIFRKGLGD